MDEVTIPKLMATCLPESWLGSFSKTGRITGDIVSPAVLESEWEAPRPDTASQP